MVTIFPAVRHLRSAGWGDPSGGFIFAFVGPLFALLALGPARATAWLFVYLASSLGLILVDPIISSAIPLQPYGSAPILLGVEPQRSAG